jgi:signal peptide peptidase SppA
LASAWDSLWAMRAPHAALVRIEGAIDANTDASAEHVIKGLRSAFENEKVKALALEIDSPGGSPVQAEMIHREIRRLKAFNPEHRIVAVINDTGASAAYYIAVAADEIYANRASLVGSIGVRMDSFGFTDAMQRLGIERWLYVAGDHKGALDMFSPVRAEVEAHIRDTLARGARPVHRGGEEKAGGSGSMAGRRCSPACSGAGRRPWRWDSWMGSAIGATYWMRFSGWRRGSTTRRRRIGPGESASG